MSKMWFTIRSVLNVYEGFDVMQKSLDEFITIDHEDYEIKDNVVGESSMECRREVGKCPYCRGVRFNLHSGAMYLYFKNSRVRVLADMEHIYSRYREGLIENIIFL